MSLCLCFLLAVGLRGISCFLTNPPNQMTPGSSLNFCSSSSTTSKSKINFYFENQNNNLKSISSIDSNFQRFNRLFSTRATADGSDYKYTLVLLRHGESTWNDENRFTGWYDCPLSTAGYKEAEHAGEVLKEYNYTFDIAHTSFLKRAINTLWLVLDALDLVWIPVKKSWRLNERHYGGLQGLNKPETVEKHGTEQVNIWRRSYDIPPPIVDTGSEHYPGNDPKYADVPKEDLPLTESLSTTKDRFLVEWENAIVPDIKSGKKVVIAAHGNTLRALVQHLDGISKDEITGLNIPTGVPLVYHLDENLKPVPHPDAIAPLQGFYLGNQEEIKARIEGVANQTGAAKK